jgi:hypothetical protein
MNWNDHLALSALHESLASYMGHGRNTDRSVPPYRSVRALPTHTAPTSSIWRESAFQDKGGQRVPWVIFSELLVQIYPKLL